MEQITGQADLELSLDTCDLEPIHTPGSVQPFGALLAGPMDLIRIEYCSANVIEYLGSRPSDLLGATFADVLGSRIVHDTRNLLSLSTARTQRERVGTYEIEQGRFEVYVHLNPSDQAIVEIEPAENHPDERHRTAIDQMRKFLGAASARDTIKSLLDYSVAGLQALTGYDRIMAYRYAENGDGEVVSEMRNARADSLLGLRYPAWDVPEQARALQVKNPLRMLVDVRQDPSPILAQNRDAEPIDISLAHLRGISPIHVEYLQNMGVGATLTIGLVVDGKLWGMFACHHMSPRVITSDVRIAAELFGQMISLVIKQKLDFEATQKRQKAAEARERIIGGTDAKIDLLNSFPKLAPILRDVIESDGVAITYEGKVLTHGSTPKSDAVRAFNSYQPQVEDIVLPIENLSEYKLIPENDLEMSGGALLIRATAAFPMQLIYFRDEITRQLRWAGKPEKELEPGPFGPRISPRGSFEAYVENQKGYCEPWTQSELSAARELQVMLTQITAKGERVQLMRHQDLVNHKRQQDLMIAELNHRVKNILALIRSLSRQAKASSASLESYARALEQRIAALAAAHDLAVSDNMKGVSLRGILTTELNPFLDDDSSQVLMSGPLVGLRADVAPIVALVLHEVVSNAAKYGALSVSDGIVRIKWVKDDEAVSLSWHELNGPEVFPPERHGFGRSLIEKAIPYELDGETELKFDPGGVRFNFKLPATNLVELDAETTSKLVGSIGRVERAAEGTLALLIEDNVVLAMDMVDSLTRLGCERVETAGTIESGLEAADSQSFDLAILDMNLRGTVSFSIAEKLKEREIPFLFVTGYGLSIDIPPDLSNVPVLTKPIDEGALSKTVQALLGGK
ncbi:MAG: GAF domain-containing protein [Sulfitobacter sp.]|nr:GAF domain-containing protein [Sulfitobacter sp.]